jgi:hypothetical protein
MTSAPHLTVQKSTGGAQQPWVPRLLCSTAGLGQRPDARARPFRPARGPQADQARSAARGIPCRGQGRAHRRRCRACMRMHVRVGTLRADPARTVAGVGWRAQPLCKRGTWEPSERLGRLAHAQRPPRGRLHGPQPGRRFFLSQCRFSDPVSGSGPVHAPKDRFSPGFLLHRLRHLPVHAIVSWGGRLHPYKEGEDLQSPKSPTL